MTITTMNRAGHSNGDWIGRVINRGTDTNLAIVWLPTALTTVIL